MFLWRNNENIICFCLFFSDGNYTLSGAVVTHTWVIGKSNIMSWVQCLERTRFSTQTSGVEGTAMNVVFHQN